MVMNRQQRSRVSTLRRVLMGGRKLPLSLLSVFFWPLPGCQDGGLSVQEVRTRGFLRAGYSEEPPYAYLDSAGRITGESPQALQLATEALQVEEIRWIRLDFRDLIPALEQGRIDVIAAGMYRTPDRASRIRFTRPTACSEPALVMEAGAAGVPDLDAALDQSLRLAVLAGSVEQAALQRLGVSDQQILATPDVRTALSAILDGKVDALMISEPTARWFIRHADDQALRVVAYDAPAPVQHLLHACSALGLRPEDRSLAAALDSAVAKVIGSPARHGMLQPFGFSDPHPPPSGHLEDEW